MENMQGVIKEVMILSSLISLYSQGMDKDLTENPVLQNKLHDKWIKITLTKRYLKWTLNFLKADYLILSHNFTSSNAPLWNSLRKIHRAFVNILYPLTLQMGILWLGSTRERVQSSG